jgi:hypothetical protein
MVPGCATTLRQNKQHQWDYLARRSSMLISLSISIRFAVKRRDGCKSSRVACIITHADLPVQTVNASTQSFTHLAVHSPALKRLGNRRRVPGSKTSQEVQEHSKFLSANTTKRSNHSVNRKERRGKPPRFFRKRILSSARAPLQGGHGRTRPRNA